MTIVPEDTAVAHDHEHDYSALLVGVSRSFTRARREGALFCTDAENLNKIYLDALPAERQVHNCHACRRFIERYGGLATIAEDGALHSAMWIADVPDFYEQAFANLESAVRRARVTSVFWSSDQFLGTPSTPPWRHMAVEQAPTMRYREGALTAAQTMAASAENFRTVTRALAEFRAPVLDEALRILEADALTRSGRFVAPVRWLRALHDRPRGRAGENVLWRAIADAPEGYMHPRASVLGPLLEAIADEKPFPEIERMFRAMMHPLVYQRPQTSPEAGNIEQAEKLVQRLGIERSLHRRFARLDEVLPHATWRPAPPPDAPSGGGVFAHLRPRSRDEVRSAKLPTQTMTWRKFQETVLPRARELEFYVPVHGNFTAMLTAEHADAPPILKWDREDERNPVSCYVYHRGSPAERWGLVGYSYVRVAAVVPRPELWGSRPMKHLVGEGVTLVLEGAVDSREDAGVALFPEILRDDLHSVRRTIEAYSRKAQIGGRAHASACGYGLSEKHASQTLRAHDGASWTQYSIDRWD